MSLICQACSEEIKVGDKALYLGNGHMHIACYSGSEKYIGRFVCTHPMGASDLQQEGGVIKGYNTIKGLEYDLFVKEGSSGRFVSVYKDDKYLEYSQKSRFEKVNDNA